MKQIPKKFWQRLESIYTKEQIHTINEGFTNTKISTTLRVNTLKSSHEKIEKYLGEKNIEYKKNPYLKDGYSLLNTKESDLWKHDIFVNGEIYLQSPSSQIPVEHMEIKAGQTILDVTAAPGSKTSQISAHMNNTGKIVANDNNAIRIDKLKFTLKRQGVNNVEVIKGPAQKLSQQFAKETFDRILADLPCSAEGRIQLHNEKSYGFWSEENILKNAKVQKEILESILPLLKVGGILLYSTCTLAPEENEMIVDFLIKNFPLQIENIDIQHPHITHGIERFENHSFHPDVTKTIRCLPSTESQGFYIAKLKKIG